MNATKIPFSNSNAYIIQNERYKSDILETIWSDYNINIFSSYDRKYTDHMLPAFRKYNILSCLITSGRPYILYFTKILNENICLMIDLRLNNTGRATVLAIPVSCSDVLFEGTIILGELFKISNTQNWEYLVERCIVYKNKVTKLNNHIGNIAICLDIIGQCNPHTLTPFNIKMKTFVSLNKLEHLLNNTRLNIIGVKFYGLKVPTTYYCNTKYYNNVHHFQKPKILAYSSDTNISSEKLEILQSFGTSQSTTCPNYNVINDILDSDINLEEAFDVTLTKTDTYGIYSISCDRTNIGLSRITTIELHNDVWHMLQSRTKIAVSGFYDYNFDKWTIIEIISDRVPQFAQIGQINSHINLLKTIPKANYLQID
jgi:hypothetical protein